MLRPKSIKDVLLRPGVYFAVGHGSLYEVKVRGRASACAGSERCNGRGGYVSAHTPKAVCRENGPAVVANVDEVAIGDLRLRRVDASGGID